MWRPSHVTDHATHKVCQYPIQGTPSSTRSFQYLEDPSKSMPLFISLITQHLNQTCKISSFVICEDNRELWELLGFTAGKYFLHSDSDLNHQTACQANNVKWHEETVDVTQGMLNSASASAVPGGSLTAPAHPPSNPLPPGGSNEDDVSQFRWLWGCFCWLTYASFQDVNIDNVINLLSVKDWRLLTEIGRQSGRSSQ